MKEDDYIGLARRAWEEAAPIHWRVTRRFLEEIKDPRRRDVHYIQIGELERIGVSGARVAQLNCNNGVELITIKRLGARSCTGFDISEGFIVQAHKLASAARVDCEFVCCDVYEVPRSFDGTFDIVVVTAGAIWFMPDLSRYFQLAHRLLRPNGVVNLYESHPITTMFKLDRDRTGGMSEMVYSYFDDSPRLHESGLDYQGGTVYQGKPVYKFPHKLSDIVTACLQAGFAIERFIEHDQDPSRSVESLERKVVKPPLSFLLTARAGSIPDSTMVQD